MDPDLPHRVLAACLTVHQHLGPGLTREAYLKCLEIEMRDLELGFACGQPPAFRYRGRSVQLTDKADFLVEGVLLVQVLACEEVRPSDLARVESLLRLGGWRSGLLVNFNVPALRKGVHRVTLKRREETHPHA